MSDFSERVAAALDTDDAVAAADRVHQVVRDELTTLDDAIAIEPTGYFNHSFVPDFVIKWRASSGSAADQRSLFLRHSLLSSEASRDAEDAQAGDRPIFLSLAENDAKRVTSRMRKRVQSLAPESLVTTVPAVDELSSTDAPDPLLGVVRANVLRGGRGVLPRSHARKLILPNGRDLDDKSVEEFQRIVETNFSEAARLQIDRVSLIVATALNDNQGQLGSDAWDGQLSDAEIRRLLPFLLSHEGVRDDREFWRAIGRTLTLQRIEGMSSEFSDLDLTRLVTASADLWTGTRAIATNLSVDERSKQAGESRDDLDDSTNPQVTETREFDWRFSRRCVAVRLGDWEIQVAHAGQKIRASEDFTPLRWTDVRSSTVDQMLTRVKLQGVSKSFVSAGVTDMTQDVENIVANVEDSFHVPEISVAHQDGDELRTINVDYLSRIVMAGNASVAALVQVAGALLTTSSPIDRDLLDRATGITASADRADDSADATDRGTD